MCNTNKSNKGIELCIIHFLDDISYILLYNQAMYKDINSYKNNVSIHDKFIETATKNKEDKKKNDRYNDEPKE